MSQALDYLLTGSVGAQVFQPTMKVIQTFMPQAGETEYTLVTKSSKFFLLLFSSIHFILILYVLYRTLWHYD